MKPTYILIISSLLLFSIGNSKELPPYQKVVGPFEPLAPDEQYIDGYLGHWLENAIDDELFQFPIEDYLFPYYTSGITNGRWITGEFTGKYMHAMSMAYAYKYPKDSWTYKELRSRMDMILHAWLHFQKQNNGYIGIHISNDREPWEDLWNVWHVKYVLLGLVKYYELFGNEEALEAAKWLGDHFINEFVEGNRSFEGSELGPVFLESMAMLYKQTGIQKYLDACYWIMEDQVEPELIKLINNEDKLPFKHVYSMQSHLISTLELYEIEGNHPEYLRAAERAVELMVQNKRFITGGFSTSEFFTTDHVFGCFHDDHPQEACASAHFIYLCRKLFFITGNPKYINDIEYTLYNSALTSKNPNNGWETSYYSPLQGKKEWKETHHKNGTPCCSQSITRELTWLPEYTWVKDRSDGLAILLYTAGSLEDTILSSSGEEIQVKLEIDTDYPRSGNITIDVSPEKRSRFQIKFRVPSWCNSYVATIGTESYQGVHGQFLTINREWKKGDKLHIQIDMPVKYLRNPSMPDYVAIQRGPQVLAVDSAVNAEIEQLDQIRIDLSKEFRIAELETDVLPDHWWGTQVYGINNSNLDQVKLVPYAEVGQIHESTYVTLMRTLDEWKEVDDSEFNYSGEDWMIEEQPLSHWGGSAHVSSQPGDSAEIRFTGSAVELYSCAVFNPWSPDKRKICEVKIILDGESQGIYTLMESQHQRILFKKEGLIKGSHTLKIVNQGKFAFVDYLRYR